MDFISSRNVPPPAGHYSQAVRHAGLVFVSGMLPITAIGEKIRGSMAEQTRQVLQNIEAVLRAAESSVEQVIKVTVYVSDIKYWDEVNSVYAEFFGAHRPARAVVPTRDLHFGLGVEMDVVAACNENPQP
ncbi:MAG: RidA family protein [Proteobacteria bacterium]|nr:RidA family protein [Pseudomonadota bacterium]MBU1611692.1 RidA family protein [Pseudomonadota bacterium]